MWHLNQSITEIHQVSNAPSDIESITQQTDPSDREYHTANRNQEYHDALFKIEQNTDSTSRALVCNNMFFDLSYESGNHGGSFSPQLNNPSTVLLMQNVSIQGFVRENEWVYFQVCIARLKEVLSIRIELTSMEGDADLYMSADNPHPDKTHSTWISTDLGNDKVTLRTDLEDYVSALAKNPDTSGQTLYLGVFGRSASSFTVRVLVTDFEGPSAASSPGLRGSAGGFRELMRERRRRKRGKKEKQQKAKKKKFIHPSLPKPKGTKNAHAAKQKKDNKREVR
jgi:hypothetical protein